MSFIVELRCDFQSMITRRMNEYMNINRCENETRHFLKRIDFI